METSLYQELTQVASATTPLDETPFAADSFDVPGVLSSSSFYFAAAIQTSKGERLAVDGTWFFTPDPQTFVDGCPPEGQIAASFGS